MKIAKKRKLDKIKLSLDSQLKKDVEENKKSKSRSLNLWLMIVNSGLPSSYRIKNNRELACIFKFFKFTKGTTETTDDGGFRRIVFYRYLGGYKDGY